jgi:hypothetical protein
MKSKLLNISGVEILSRENLKNIVGSAIIDMSKCGCSCSGSVTGPAYCQMYMACIQVYTCNEEM